MTDKQSCESCGVAWEEHLGIVGTCRGLSEIKAAIGMSPFDLGCCDMCGELVIDLADGLPVLCLECLEKLAAEQ